MLIRLFPTMSLTMITLIVASKNCPRPKAKPATHDVGSFDRSHARLDPGEQKAAYLGELRSDEAEERNAN
jgi:hypothetical protein